ncbi:MAG: helix-turn-helix domain-containing protein [Oscillospiraceae bacterium]|nr:helix-turn-helix domain-containing protein [Oscillospiraceae bacterium]
MDYRKTELLNIFNGLKAADIRNVCECFGVSHRTFDKGKPVFEPLRQHKHFGVITAGSALVMREGGDSTVVLEGGLIGQYAQRAETVTAYDRLSVLLFPYAKLTRTCAKSCTAHGRIIANFIAALSEEGAALQTRIDCLTKPNTREKALAYLTHQQCKNASEHAYFSIEHSRTEMAEYISVQHAALSRELSKMRNDGVIDFNGNQFKFK